jgi:hypothetical protein
MLSWADPKAKSERAWVIGERVRDGSGHAGTVRYLGSVASAKDQVDTRVLIMLFLCFHRRACVLLFQGCGVHRSGMG